MNIFLLDLDLRKAAQAHADKHVVKMILEACQLLYTAHWIFAHPELLEHKAPINLAKAQKVLPVPESLLSAPCSKMRPEEPGFRPCHAHHPCAVWVRESIENYGICAKLAVELAIEFRFRYPKKGAHECEAHAHWLLQNPPPGIPCIPQTQIVQAMDIQYRRADPIEGYRNYYRTSKKERGLLQYKGREPPSWLTHYDGVLSSTTETHAVDIGLTKN